MPEYVVDTDSNILVQVIGLLGIHRSAGWRQSDWLGAVTDRLRW